MRTSVEHGAHHILTGLQIEERFGAGSRADDVRTAGVLHLKVTSRLYGT